MQVLKDEYKREIDFSDRFEKPVFFEEFGIFRMADKRQVGMEDQAEVTDGHIVIVRSHRSNYKTADVMSRTHRFVRQQSFFQEARKIDHAPAINGAGRFEEFI